MDYPKVSIITLNWNGLEDTRECLESLKRINYPNYDVTVVDNGSEGNDAEVLKEEFGDYIGLVQNDRNYGCGEGFNTGIRYVLANSQADYILIINNDVVVAPDFLDELVIVAERDEQIGIVGPKIYYYNYQGRNDVIWSAGGKIRMWSLRVHRRIGENDDDLPQYQAVTSVEWLTGAVLMWKSFLTEKVGLLSDWYFFGYEDVEFCLKARRQGYKIVYVPTAKAWHKVAASLKRANITHPDTAAYYHLIKEGLPKYIYMYHLLLLPAILFRWAFLYLVRNRDMYALRKFFADFTNFILQRRKRGL